MNEELFKQLKTKLNLEHYSMNDEWLKDCSEFYVSQHENPSFKEILQFVKVQWQLSDLREINNENGSLPHNISQHKFIVLSENYILQVEQMYDIATSKYKQLEQIRNTHISETEPSESEKFDKWQPPKKRMIQLRLTDGVQDIIGIEYNYISWFNDVLLPGYKIMIMGPVKCRKGVLLLEPGKCQGIGGEVDSLLIPNALENVLARALNLKENPDPYNDNESKPNAIRPEEQKVDDSFFEEDFEINLEEVSIIESSHEKDNEQFSTNTVKTEIKTETKRENVINYNIDTKFSDKQTREEKQILDDDDCFLEMVDETQFLESQVKQENVVSSLRALPKEENDDIIIIDEEDIIEDISMPSNSEQVEHTFKNEKQISHSNFELLTSKKDSSISTVQSAVRKTREESLVIGGKRTIPMSSPEIKVSKKGKMERSITEFIKPQILNTPKICDFIHDINQEVITKTTSKTIRGHIEVLGKLAKKDSLWNLECTVGDGTGTIEVSFSNKVLEEMLGFTVQEFSAKKKLKKNPEIEQQLRTSFRSAEHRIKTLDALLELELNLNKKPIVIKITDLTQEQKGIIDKKLNNFLLNK
nr:PREDICTED: recQ-mediated genome instability protein 1-like isoform X1 [Megachile rotundata]